MEALEVASPSLDVKTEEQTETPMEPQTEPQTDMDTGNKNKKKKKKKKNKHKNLERTQSEVEEPEEGEKEENSEENKKEENYEENEKEEKYEKKKNENNEKNEMEEKKETTVENKEEAHDDDEAAVSGEEMGPPSLERQTSLDSLKASGTRAVGSLFSRFKVGRKKPQPSRSESVAQLEQVTPSPVKTAVKRLEVPEEKNLDDLPMRTKRDFFSDEQSIQVRAEKEKYDTMEKQRQLENAEEAARQTPPSSSRSNENLLAQMEAPTEDVSFAVMEDVETSVAVKSTTIESSEESSEPAAHRTTESGEMESVAAVEETIAETAQLEDDEATNEVEDNVAVSATELAADTMVETSQHTADASSTLPASLKVDLDLDIDTEATHEKVDEVIIDSTGSEETSLDTVSSNGAAQDVTSPSEDTELISIKVPPTPEAPAEVSAPEKMSPVKSLASRFEGKREQSLDSLKFRTVREFFSEERSIQVGAEKQKYEALAQQQNLKTKAEEEAMSKYNATKSSVNESAMANTPVEKETAVAIESATSFTTPETAVARKKFSFDEGYASIKTPSTFSDDASEASTPVKSIASRFEGKREQSLDSLKFRTVREFFPEVRSVRVGSEKQKLEAQAQQENSLDKLKFRTVREFFPSDDKRSVHVGAEKTKFEALTKQQKEAAGAAEQNKPKHAAYSPSPSSSKTESHDTAPASVAKKETVSTLLESSPLGFVSNDEAAGSLKEIIPSELAADEFSSLDHVEPVDVEKPEEVAGAVNDSNPSEPVAVDIPSLDHVEPFDVEKAEEVKGSVKESNPSSLDFSSLDHVEPVDAVKESNPSSFDFSSLDHVEPVDVKKGEEVNSTLTPIDDGFVIEGNTSVSDTPINQLMEGAPPEPGVANDEEADISAALTEKNLVSLEEVDHDINQETEADQELDQGETEQITNSAEKIVLDDVDLLDEPVVELEYDMNQETEVEQGLDQGETEHEDSHEIANVSEEFIGDNVGLLDEPVAETQADSTTDASQVGIDFNDDSSLQAESVGRESVEVVEQVVSSDGLLELDLGESASEEPAPILVDGHGVVDPSHELVEDGQPEKFRMLTTERSFVMEDNIVETEDTVVVSERPMTDGEDEFGPLSPTKAHELFTGTTSSSTSSKKPQVKLARSSPKLTRKLSAGSTGAPTASDMAKKPAKTEELLGSTPHLKKQGSASKLKGTLSETGFMKPPPAAPTVPVPMKRASITAPTASYKAKKAAETEKLRKSTPQLKKQGSASKLKGTVSDTGFIKPPPPAPTVPVPMKRASITAPTASYMAKKAAEAKELRKSTLQLKKQGSASKLKGTPAARTVPVPMKRVSITAPTASWQARHVPDKSTPKVSAALKRASNPRYSGVKSKVLEGIETGSMHAATHKTITKEEFIAAERRKSLGSAGVRSVLDAVDRRTSLTARVTIDGPPEPFMRSAFARKKMDSTVPRYMNYENTPGYADRARQQYERRKRLEDENTMKSEKRQRELRMHFAEKQQKALTSSAEEVRRGLEAHEFSRLAKESEVAAQKAHRNGKQRAQSTRSHHRASSTTSSSGLASRTSKKSSVASVEEKKPSATKSTVVGAVDTVENTEPQREEDTTEVQVEVQLIHVPVVDEDLALEHVAKKIDFDEASSDSDEKDVPNE